MHVGRRLELLALDAGGRQLDQRGRARRRAGARELDPVELGELVRVAQRRRRPRAAAVARPRGQRARPPARRACAPRTRRPAAHRRAPAGSRRRTPRGGGRRPRHDDRALGCRSGYATRSRVGTPTTGIRRPAPSPRGRHADPQPGEQPGPEPDRDRGELVERRRRTRRAGTRSPARAARRGGDRRRADRAEHLAAVAEARPSPARSPCRARGAARQPPTAAAERRSRRSPHVRPARVDRSRTRSSSPSPGSRQHPRAGRSGSAALDRVAPLDARSPRRRRAARRARGRAAPAGGRGGTRRRARAAWRRRTRARS